MDEGKEIGNTPLTPESRMTRRGFLCLGGKAAVVLATPSLLRGVDSRRARVAKGEVPPLPPGFSVPEFQTFEEYIDWLQKFFESGQFKELFKEIPQDTEEFPSSTEGPSCPDIDDPVCGTDNYTYNNECEAKEFYGVAVAYKGECKVE